MKNKHLAVIIKYLARTVTALTLLIAFTCWVAPTFAQEPAHEGTQAEQQNEAGAEHGSGNATEHETDLGQERAQEIAVDAPPYWYHTVIWIIAILFILAATLGSAAIILKGPEPPDPADEHAHH